MPEGPFSAKDVAKHAGVSQATVSRVLNGSTYVNEEKRAAVLSACAELGFVPNGAARALTMRKTMTFGAVVPNVANDAFALSMAAFHDRIKGAGYSLLLTSSGYDAESELQEINLLLGRGIDGLMVVGGAHHPDIYKAIERHSIPVVQTWTLSQDHPCVGFDNAAAAKRAASYLLDLGHTVFGVITGRRQDNDRAPARVQGVKDALADRGLEMRPEHDIERGYGIASGRDAMREMLSYPVRPTAILCGNDHLAFGALIEAQNQGLDVPGDLSIVGFGDFDFAPHIKPSLTTIRTSTEEIGRMAGDYLVNAVNGRPVVRRTELPADLIVRESTGRAPM